MSNGETGLAAGPGTGPAAVPGRLRTLEVPIRGMDCADCAATISRAVAAVPGVVAVDVRLGAEKAVITLDSGPAIEERIRRAIEAEGYAVPGAGAVSASAAGAGRRVMTLFGLIAGLILLVVVVGEWMGLFATVSRWIPGPVWAVAVAAGGFPVFRNVLRAALRRQVIAHSLMTLGVIAAALVGEWPAAAVVVFFMRVGDYTERFTAQRARGAVKSLVSMAPRSARVLVEGQERQVPVDRVGPGDTVLVRPGERIPVDGEVLTGRATVDQAAITGESMPVEVEPGSPVFAASLARLGSLRIRALRVGGDSTFGRVIRLVEEAEANRGEVQRLADRFAGGYLPVVSGVALLTFLLSGNPLATAAVLVVACSCAFAMATPIAMLASIGAAARRGLLIKGGRFLELLAQADVLLIDKTGTLTMGRPRLTDVVALNHFSETEALALAAAAERDSEHPLAEAVRAGAAARAVALPRVEAFRALPGLGVMARVDGRRVVVGSRRLLAAAAAADPVRAVSAPQRDVPMADTPLEPAAARIAAGLEDQGKTLLFVAVDGEPVAILAAADTLRPEVGRALDDVRSLGIARMELLTGDQPRAAAAVAGPLGLHCRAGLMPEDKIRIVREYQARGHTVMMVGDGVNDAPALAQADVGVAMGAAGTDVALEAAHAALMGDDWSGVPELLRIARRTMRVVKGNLAFTVVFNAVGLTLAATGHLPVIFAAAVQSIPDIGILANSSRLLKQP